MSISLIVYIILLSVVVSIFIMDYILSKRFKNSKLYKFWKKHIIDNIDMDDFN